MSEESPAPVPLSLASTRPVEDAGADVSGYYEFQYGWVARHALEMSDPSSDLEWILCEWHTDFILGWGDSFAPVSVKHREPNSGHWTTSTLLGDGGLLTLYKRWNELGRPKQCRWVTNGGLNTDCRALAKACASSDVAALGEWLDMYRLNHDRRASYNAHVAEHSVQGIVPRLLLDLGVNIWAVDHSERGLTPRRPPRHASVPPGYVPNIHGPIDDGVEERIKASRHPERKEH